MFKLGSVAAVVGGLGYGGLAVGLILNGAGVPIFPSEALLPLSGALVRSGNFNMWVVIPLAIGAQMAGSFTAFMISKKGGIGLVHQYGKYVLFREKELAFTQKVFTRFGKIIVLVGSSLPVLKSYISYPAGLSGLNTGEFLIFNGIGTTVWTVALTGGGYYLADNIDVISSRIHEVSLGIAIVMLLAVAWYFRKQLTGLVKK